MTPPVTPRPTDAELTILRVLWSKGPSTVRQVHDVLVSGREPLGLQHVYTARRTEQDTQRQLVKDLLDRAFDGSTSQLVMQALATTTASPAELREIRRLLTAAGTAAKEKK